MTTYVGAGATADSLQTELVAVAQTFAANANRAIALAKYVDGLGTSGLQNAGFATTGDATTFQSRADYCRTVAQIFQGTAAQPTDFDFSNAMADAIGPDPRVTPPQ
jgi:hypothetical protein